MTFTYTDRRRAPADVSPFEKELPVGNKALAAAAETMPPEVTLYEPPSGTLPEVAFDISGLQLYWGEFLNHHGVNAETGKWMKTFKPLLGKLAGDATLLRVGNVPVATFRNDMQLNMKRLAAEQPHIIAKYTKLKAVEVFDKDEFLEKEPLMHRAYRGRSLRLVKGGVDLSGLLQK